MKGLIQLCFFLMPVLASGQCLDTLNTPNDPGNACLSGGFYPVCGCNGNTYDNECYAQWATVQQWTYGPCEQVAFKIYPNPVTYWLNVTIVTKFESNVNVYIFNHSGNIAYSRSLTNVTTDYLTIPMYGYEQGLYIMMVECNGYVQLEKFIRWEEQD